MALIRAPRPRKPTYHGPHSRKHAVNKDLLSPTAAITAALITTPAPGVSRTKLSDVSALFASVYVELEKAQDLIDKMRKQAALPTP